MFNEGFDNQHFGDEGGYSPQVIKGLTIPDGFATTSEAYFYFLKETGIENKIKSIIDKIKVKLDLEEQVSNLSVANQQMVAICRALTSDLRFLILDEPTSALTKKEIDQLFLVVKDLQQK